MTYDEFKALFEETTPDNFDESKILEKFQPAPTPTPPEAPTPSPSEEPPVVPGVTKADQPITLTAAELMKFATEYAAKQTPKTETKTEDDEDAEIYL